MKHFVNMHRLPVYLVVALISLSSKNEMRWDEMR